MGEFISRLMIPVEDKEEISVIPGASISGALIRSVYARISDGERCQRADRTNHRLSFVYSQPIVLRHPRLYQDFKVQTVVRSLLSLSSLRRLPRSEFQVLDG